MTELIEILREDHRNIETLLLVLERELNIFDRAEQPDYEVVQAIIDYFRDYPDRCHHPKEDAVFTKLKTRDPAATASVGDLEAEHLKRGQTPALGRAGCRERPERARSAAPDGRRHRARLHREGTAAHGDGGAHSISRRGQSATAGRLGGDRCETPKRFVARQSERREVQLAAAAHTAMGAGKRVRQADPLRLSALELLLLTFSTWSLAACHQQPNVLCCRR
jgi:Hemerythrin HHE cation binding domain